MNDEYQTQQYWNNNMKKSELKQIIKEEIRKVLNESDYDQAMQNLAKQADINLSEPAGRNKFRAPKEQEYEVGYWEYTNYGPEGMTIEVMATSEKEAIEKAEGKTRGKRGSYKVIAIDGVKK
jgi:hypothetical protein